MPIRLVMSEPPWEHYGFPWYPSRWLPLLQLLVFEAKLWGGLFSNWKYTLSNSKLRALGPYVWRVSGRHETWYPSTAIRGNFEKGKIISLLSVGWGALRLSANVWRRPAPGLTRVDTVIFMSSAFSILYSLRTRSTVVPWGFTSQK